MVHTNQSGVNNSRLLWFVSMISAVEFILSPKRKSKSKFNCDLDYAEHSLELREMQKRRNVIPCITQMVMMGGDLGRALEFGCGNNSNYIKNEIIDKTSKSQLG